MWWRYDPLLCSFALMVWKCHRYKSIHTLFQNLNPTQVTWVRQRTWWSSNLVNRKRCHTDTQGTFIVWCRYREQRRERETPQSDWNLDVRWAAILIKAVHRFSTDTDTSSSIIINQHWVQINNRQRKMSCVFLLLYSRLVFQSDLVLIYFSRTILQFNVSV